MGTSGTALGRSFAHSALQGGGYVTYNWAVTENDPASEKISFVIGVRRFGVSYYVGVGFDHVIKPQVSTS